MTMFPDGFNPRDEIIGALALVAIDAPSGIARFMPGQEGKFTDSAGAVWWGSQLIDDGDVEWSRNGEAPAGQLSMTYFQDPDAPALIDELRESGDDVLRGRTIWFHLQPLGRHEDLYAPRWPPILIATRTAGALQFEAQGDVVRRLTLMIEGPLAPRRTARGFYYTVADHGALIGTPNPSLAYMPQHSRAEEKLFG